MKPDPLRNGLRPGITFAVIIIFLVLIGFTVTGAALVAKLFGIYVPQGSPPDVRMLAIFLGLLGLWAGANAARPVEPDTYKNAGAGGLVAGIVTGLVIWDRLLRRHE